jgi:hypothetical protein
MVLTYITFFTLGLLCLGLDHFSNYKFGASLGFDGIKRLTTEEGGLGLSGMAMFVPLICDPAQQKLAATKQR